MTGKHVTWAGAGKVGAGTPWGTIAEVGARLLRSAGYQVTIETRSTSMENIRFVADSRADIGTTHYAHLLQAYRGVNDWRDEGPRDYLRAVANVMHPSWLAVAVKARDGLHDLAQIAAERLPVVVRRGKGRVCDLTMQHYGLTPQRLHSWGGRIEWCHPRPLDVANRTGVDLSGWVASGDFDVIVDTVYGAYAPEVHHFIEASVLHDLRFLDLAPALQERIASEGLGSAALLPHHLLRGLQESVATIARVPQVIYCRRDSDPDLIRLLARLLLDNTDAFGGLHIPFQLTAGTVTRDYGVPFHEAAQAALSAHLAN